MLELEHFHFRCIQSRQSPRGFFHRKSPASQDLQVQTRSENALATTGNTEAIHENRRAHCPHPARTGLCGLRAKRLPELHSPTSHAAQRRPHLLHRDDQVALHGADLRSPDHRRRHPSHWALRAPRARYTRAGDRQHLHHSPSARAVRTSAGHRGRHTMVRALLRLSEILCGNLHRERDAFLAGAFAAVCLFALAAALAAPSCCAFLASSFLRTASNF